MLNSFVHINTLDGGFDIPIPVIFVVGAILVFLLIAFFIAAVGLSTKYFVCDKCGKRFKPKLHNCFFKPYYSDSGSTILKCPSCKKHRACTRSYKQD